MSPFTNDRGICYNLNQETHVYKLIVKGDLTGEGKVNIADLTTLNRGILGKITLKEEQIKAGDLDKNNRISIADLSTLNKHVLGKIKL